MSQPLDARHRRDNQSNPGVIMPTPPSTLGLPADYGTFLAAVKQRIGQDRLKAQLSANAIQMVMYWDLGTEILIKQQGAGWGAKVIDRLSSDLRNAFPAMQGFSSRNLKYMRAFAEAWPDREFVQRTVAQIPWRSNLTLLEKLKDAKLREWYAHQTLKNGWSKNILAIQIDMALHLRVGQSANNFELTLLPLDSDMANQIFKDPYLFDFLGTTQVRKEAELENRLVEHLENFFLELGQEQVYQTQAVEAVVECISNVKTMFMARVAP